MNARFRPLRWQGPSTPQSQRRSRWTFKASWQDTLDLLARELGYLDARDVVIEADFSEGDIRLDGMPRSNARQPAHPGIRIAFDSKHGPLVYATDSCASWQHNVRSIALGLEALRAVDRYGVTRRGEQYTGWRAIEAGRAAAPTSDEIRTAWVLIHETAYPGIPVEMRSDDVARVVERARRRAHPDLNGGDQALWDAVTAAAAVLDSQGGAS